MDDFGSCDVDQDGARREQREERAVEEVRGGLGQGAGDHDDLCVSQRGYEVGARCVGIEAGDGAAKRHEHGAEVLRDRTGTDDHDAL